MSERGPGSASEDVAVIVVNYGTAALAIAAVDSVIAHRNGDRRLSIHLVDNASPGDDAHRIARAHQERGWGARVTLYLEDRNLGFGGGNNLVLEALAARPSPPEKVFLLNPDARIENEAIEILARTLDETPDAAAAGAALRDEHGRPMAGAFRFPSFAGELVRVMNFGPLDRVLGGLRPSLPPDQSNGPVDWVSGAAVMFRFSALRDVGFFDPAFFLYYEEVELMLRLSRAGWSTIYVPQAVVTHIEGAATGRGKSGRVRRPAYLYNSWRHYFVISLGRVRALALALLVIPASVFNVVQRRLRGDIPNTPLRFMSDHWRMVVWPLMSGRDGP